MEQARNVLILKGNVPAEKVLDLLDALLKRIGGNGHTPEPWQLFSPLAILLGCLKKSTADCRNILRLIRKDSSCLNAVLSSYTAFARFRNLRNEIEKLVVEPCLVGSQKGAQECHTFIWKPHKADQESKHITMNNYELEKETPEGLTAAFWSSLCVQEEVYDEHPFHGLVNAAQTSRGHNRKIYVSIRPPAANRDEARSEKQKMEKMKETMKESEEIFQHFAFVVDASDPNNPFDWGVLDSAADMLSGWLQHHPS
ncbi:hypothetical protein PMIN01_13572 [Paraphaeosphaeria minitans]|uniref:Uncharacterized protein n=1 Tax=Paraphaeosphaeria minitans TaxID=565426 RepID=A0A9P6KJI3_9PLEO|nr:hypothetical protein PMIN01_13572 [Paraphaeosphaeria minitans]